MTELATRINYGCGPKIIADWLNVDWRSASSMPAKVRSMLPFYRQINLIEPHPFPDAHFARAFSEDFLEHLTQGQSIIFLCEVYRTMQPGGIFRLSTPGLLGAMRRHLPKANWQGAAGFHHNTYTRWDHKHLYTRDLLEAVAQQIGFSDGHWCAYGQSAHPELLHDTRPDQADMNLVIELTK
jgi:predicted SAM-dependent methyltransferase